MQVEKNTPTAVVKSPAPRPPAVGTPKPPTPAARSPQSGELVRGLTMPRSAFVGFCLTAFACGVVTTVAVDRIWPRRADDALLPVSPARAADLPSPPPASPVVQPLPRAAIAPAAIAVAPSIVESRPPSPTRVAAGAPSPLAARRRPAAVAEHAPLAESPRDPPAPSGKWIDPFE